VAPTAMKVRSIEKLTALRGTGEIVAWSLSVGALIGAAVTEGPGILHAVLLTGAFALLSGILIGRRMRRPDDKKTDNGPERSTSIDP
jgi:hypothetical protein